MKTALAFAWFFFFFFDQTGHTEPATKLPDYLAELIVPLDEPSEFLETAKKSLADSLAEIGATFRKSPRSVVTESGEFVVWGNLFKTGNCFAIVELSPGGVCFAEWKDGRWELRGLWKILGIWKPKGWEGSDEDPSPVTPAIEPIKLRDLSGDGVSEVVVGRQLDRYNQLFYVLRFSRKTHRLKLVTTAMGRPEVVGEYVRVHVDSGRLSVFEEWEFLKWKGEDLISVASWHDEVAYGGDDPTFVEGKRTVSNGKTETIRLVYGKGLEFEGGDYELFRLEKRLGTISFQWNGENSPTLINSGHLIEQVWLFEKMTGLPRRYFPCRHNKKAIPRLEGLAGVKVEGNPETQKLFSIGEK